MNITNRTGLVGFLLILAALNVPSSAEATTEQPATIEARLSRLSSAVRERVNQLPNPEEDPTLQAFGWADGSRNRGWVNGRVGGWTDGHRGSFVNARPWGNGWSDFGRFNNFRPGWLNGSSFGNARPGGGFLNRR
jgi:rSAM-associated Gly-rich repeat protein